MACERPRPTGATIPLYGIRTHVVLLCCVLLRRTGVQTVTPRVACICIDREKRSNLYRHASALKLLNGLWHESVHTVLTPRPLLTQRSDGLTRPSPALEFCCGLPGLSPNGDGHRKREEWINISSDANATLPDPRSSPSAGLSSLPEASRVHRLAGAWERWHRKNN